VQYYDTNSNIESLYYLNPGRNKQVQDGFQTPIVVGLFLPHYLVLSGSYDCRIDAIEEPAIHDLGFSKLPL